IVGPFLERERVFVFGTPGNEQYYFSSADWMPRNLHRRVEVLVPVQAASLRDRIQREVLQPALQDNSCAYDMNSEGNYVRRSAPEGEAAPSAQLEVLVGPTEAPPPEAAPATPTKVVVPGAGVPVAVEPGDLGNN